MWLSAKKAMLKSHECWGSELYLTHSNQSLVSHDIVQKVWHLQSIVMRVWEQVRDRGLKVWAAWHSQLQGQFVELRALGITHQLGEFTYPFLSWNRWLNMHTQEWLTTAYPNNVCKHSLPIIYIPGCPCTASTAYSYNCDTSCILTLIEVHADYTPTSLAWY